MAADDNYTRWEQIYKTKGPGNFLRYPNEVFVGLFYRYRALINQQGRALDYGFGSGNNAELLIQNMRHVYGIEISESAIQEIANRLGKYENFEKRNFSLAFDEALNGFDLVLAWQVLCYNNQQTFEEKAAELVNKLNAGGVLITSITTHDDMKVTTSEKIATNTYKITNAIPHQEGCVIYSPASVDEFISAFMKPGIEVIDHGYFSNGSHLTDTKLSEYYLVVKKL